ncbi:MAG TPA: hypothetical protein VHV27_10065 [Phenylobacterium sp.]|jgi:parvulin-like peptidyl-prolyl isomerase|nr:hypothetical protein [Phenylobacterium sp.]
MNTKLAAALVALTALAAAPALAQAPAAPAAAPAAASGKLSVETTTVADIVKNPEAKAALEKTLPQISQYYDQIGGMTLKQVQPMSQGAITDDMLKTVQADFDKIK